MAIRTGHGAGAGRPHVEVLPPDEQPKGLAAAPERDARGRFVSGGAKNAGRRGGLAKAANAGTRSKLSELLGLAKPDGELAPYADLAERFCREETAEIAATTGGGRLAPGVVSIIASAALQKAASTWMFDRGLAKADTGLLEKASKLANDSRQNLLAASEMAAKHAVRRADHEPDAMQLAQIEFQRRLAERNQGNQ